ncbi:unnamed protein product [Darwinula stevensoni]|uniref:Uncharacterized protein n=1 Tax=Darwinula stevensoni TaxID=69355 RepID=A0A7R8X528_9CRUS|nr:unnamed protein product [Darwinula stevensoni]CAG0886214.1 unnamed protein product [Darwinula stevensoni]
MAYYPGGEGYPKQEAYPNAPPYPPPMGGAYQTGYSYGQQPPPYGFQPPPLVQPVQNVSEGGAGGRPYVQVIPQGPASGPHGAEEGGTGFAASFSDKNIRRRFVSRVYGILSIQLLFTLALIALFVFVSDIKLFIVRNQWVYWISYVVFLSTFIALVCCPGVRRKSPTNMIVLAIFTAALAFMAATISAFHKTEIVLIAVGITAGVTVLVSLFATTTKWDVTGCGMFLCIASVVVFLFGIAAIIVFAVDKGTGRIVYVCYAGLIALLFTMYLMYDTQMIVGGRKHELSAEEHVYGALTLYLDIVYIFLAILNITSYFGGD